MSLLLLLLHTLLWTLLLVARTSEAIQRVRASVSIGSSRGGGGGGVTIQRRLSHGCTGPLMAKRRTTLGEQQRCNAHSRMHV